MPSDKQRKRQERFRRHGVERPVSPQREQKAARRAAEAEAGASKKGKKGSGSRQRTHVRKPVAFPTVRRCLIRAPIFGLIWFVLMRFLLSGGNTTPMQDFAQAAILTGVMFPLLFMTDSITYRLAVRRELPVQPRPRDGYLGFRP